MKRLFRDYGIRRLIVIICLICTAFMYYGPAWGIDSPGLKLRIYGDETYPDLKFTLGQPVKVTMVIKNDTNFDINTERGFSKLEPHRHLVLFDPDGAQHVLGANVMSGDAPPPFFLGSRATIPAEKLPRGWVKSEIILDLTELFPVMKDMAVSMLSSRFVASVAALTLQPEIAPLVPYCSVLCKLDMERLILE